MDRFNPLDLEMDSKEMLGRLKTWVHCESPSWDAAAVNRMADLVSYELAVLDARIDRIKISGFGDALRARFPHRDQIRAGILVLGHLDTVHPTGSMFWRRDDNACYGPGILDMKAGNFLVLEALRHLKAHGVPTPLSVTILFTSDEEVGSAASRQLIEAEALRSKYVLVPEPARPDGSLVEGRHAVARFRLRTDGRSGHAGHAAAAGVSAIREMAERVIALEELSNGEAYCRVGVINGGKWLNCVPMVCEAELLVVAQTQPALDDLVGRITSETAKLVGARFHVEPGPLRPFWKPSSTGNPILEKLVQ